MSFVTSKELLLDAQQNGYAIGAFNCENMEMVQAVIAAAEEQSAPVIIQTTSGTLRYGSADLYAANVYSLAKNSPVPICLHLDHGSSVDLAVLALRAGYTSVMIDGSNLPLEQNIALTKQVVDLCTPCNVPVEGELGHVGGKEDDTVSQGNQYTDPDEAVRFVEETGISSLAVGIGTAHGLYATTPKLNIELISTLRQRISQPMVLHGTSGLSEEVVKECIQRGICKVNFATELRQTFTLAVRKYLEENPKAMDPKSFGTYAKKAVQNTVSHWIQVFGSAGKA